MANTSSPAPKEQTPTFSQTLHEKIQWQILAYFTQCQGLENKYCVINVITPLTQLYKPTMSYLIKPRIYGVLFG